MMDYIGRNYDPSDYNCAHFLADWYRDKLGIEIPTGSVWELSFAVWLRRHFTEIPEPVENCVVLMTTFGMRHIGVYSRYGVYHNYRAGKSHGSVVHWELGLVKRNYQQVSFWQWSK